MTTCAPSISCLMTTLALGGIAAGQWRPEPSFPAGADSRAHPAGIRVGDAIYAIGGMPFDDGNNAAVHRLTVPDGTWTTLPPVEASIIRQGAGVDALGRIIVFGGHDAIDPEADPGRTFVYDDEEGQWYDVAERSPEAASTRFAWVTDDAGRIWSIGGPGSTRVERYDGTLDAWTVMPPLPTPRADAAAVIDRDGRILVIGGIDTAASARLATIAVFDPATDTWSEDALPPLPEALSDHQAVRAADDRIHVLGGLAGPVGSGTPRSAVHVLTLDGVAWTTGVPMSVPRRSFAAVLGSDARIYAAGGWTAAGATTSVESLPVAACPVESLAPTGGERWAGQTLELRGAFDATEGAVLEWRRNGVALSDGSAPGGGTITGAATEVLRVTNLAPADAGTYVLHASNACGSTESTPAVITVREAGSLPTTWIVTNLHPTGALGSSAGTTDGTVIAGHVVVPDPDFDQMGHPTIWPDLASPPIDLTPPDSVGGSVSAVGPGVQVGWYWWPYQCQIGGQWYTCYQRRGARWSGTAASHEIMHGSGWEYSSVADTDGTTHVGTLSDDDASGNTYARAVRFNGGYSTTSLTFDGWSKTFANAVDGGRIFGSGLTPFPAPQSRALMWSEVDADPVVMHPPDGTRSWIVAAGDGQQVGTVAYGNDQRPTLWYGSSLDPRTLATAGGTVHDCAGGFQVGAIAGHAVVWNGRTDVWHDLHTSLGSEFGSSSAEAIHVADDGTIVVVGWAYDPVLERSEAIHWAAAAGIPGDVDGDGVVNLADLLTVLAAWGPCPGRPCAADQDGDGVVGFGDLVAVLSNWS